MRIAVIGFLFPAGIILAHPLCVFEADNHVLAVGDGYGVTFVSWGCFDVAGRKITKSLLALGGNFFGRHLRFRARSAFLRRPIMMGLRAALSAIGGDIDVIARQQEALITDSKTTKVELALASCEIKAAIEGMRRA